MLNAQRSGVFSPFVSTSSNRNVARSFALDGNTPGFILTIEGPEDRLYDFRQIREMNRIPHPSEFMWLNEFGIPLQIEAPFTVTKVEEIQSIMERKRRVRRKAKRR
jgi:hypothetical protein